MATFLNDRVLRIMQYTQCLELLDKSSKCFHLPQYATYQQVIDTMEQHYPEELKVITNKLIMEGTRRRLMK